MKMRRLKWYETLGIAGAVLIGVTGAECKAGESQNYQACKKAGGDTKSGTCVKPGFRCDGEEGSGGGYHHDWYICEGDPPRWVKEKYK
jgi:hypothetical protein